MAVVRRCALLQSFAERRQALMRFLARRPDNPDLAADVAHETWLRIARGPGSGLAGDVRTHLSGSPPGRRDPSGRSSGGAFAAALTVRAEICLRHDENFRAGRRGCAAERPRNQPMQTMRGALLVGATILALPLVAGPPRAAIAQRIGITSAVTGDPTGKPPDEVERVLHVGIDVKAGEVVTTGAVDRAHLLFLDGTALTISNQAQVTLDRFVYDADQKLGDLAVTATKGVFRLVGGRISKKTPIVVATPSATLSIRGGIAMFTVEPTRTTATFMFGHEMTITGQGRTEHVTVPGFQVSTTLGHAPGLPMRAAPGSLAGPIGRLEAAGRAPDAGADRAAKATGFADANSGRGPNASGPIQGGPQPSSPGGPNGPGGPPRMGGPGMGGGGFDPGLGPAPSNPPVAGGAPRTGP